MKKLSPHFDKLLPQMTNLLAHIDKLLPLMDNITFFYYFFKNIIRKNIY